LCLYNAGLTYSYQLAPAADVVSAGTYTIKDVEIVACLVTPIQSYLQEVAKGIESGSTLKVPVQFTKCYTAPLSGSSTTPTLNLNIGYMSSINTLSLVNKSGMEFTTNLQDFYITVDSVRYPLNKQVFGAEEALYQTLAGYSTELSSISKPADQQSFKHLSWKSNGSFAQGIPSANGGMELQLGFGSTPAGTLECIIGYDAMLIVSANKVDVVSDF
jgi:hypothetical protein